MKHLKDLLEKKFERVQPKTNAELIETVQKYVELLGKDADLNFIDTSKITDMSYVFCEKISREFNGDISKWDTSNVINMSYMFAGSKFNRDISRWDVSNVENMHAMFFNAENFNCDISDWDISNVTDMTIMFGKAGWFHKDISKWTNKLKKNVKHHKFAEGAPNFENKMQPKFK